MRIAEALRLIRTRHGLTQTAASKREGAPDFRTLSHWETRRKLPSLKLLDGYLRSLGLDFSDLQEALDQVEGKPPKRLEQAEKLLREGFENLTADVEFRRQVESVLATGVEQRLGEVERRLKRLEHHGSPLASGLADSLGDTADLEP